MLSCKNLKGGSGSYHNGAAFPPYKAEISSLLSEVNGQYAAAHQLLTEISKTITDHQSTRGLYADMSSLWGSRFQTTEAVGQSQGRRISAEIDIGNVLAAAHESLPQIDPTFLTADKFLGSGSMFHVNREIYDEKNDPLLKHYVAVKYMRVEQRPETHRQILVALLRELRVITHPVLRSHPHIISAFGYGWTGFNFGEPRPFLVMPYADFGTLSEVLQAVQLQRQVSILERHDLALDVASGLQALHERGIIHGDVKANNVLVCQRSEPLGYTFGDDNIPWVAKIADFGSSLTREEADEHVFKYTGTALYNAPEIEGHDGGFSNTGSFEAYKKADIYSFGLLLWEVMKMGCFYLDTFEDDDVSFKKKRYRDYLQKKHGEPGDALLEIAFRSLQDVRAETADSKVWDTIVGALTACLRKNASQRASVTNVFEQLHSSARYVTSLCQNDSWPDAVL